MRRTEFSLHKEDWSLHRKGQQDQERHRDKVKQAIKENLPDLVSEESIVMSDGQRIVKIPIRSLEEYRFRYNHSKSRQAGSGDGSSGVGDVIASGRPDGQSAGQGQGAGDTPGTDYTEADVTLEDIENVLFAQLELPNLAPKSADAVMAPDIDFRDVRRKGLMGNIDKKRTLLESIRRHRTAAAVPARIIPDDLRFKTWEDVVRPDSNAVVLALMDTSGSMAVSERNNTGIRSMVAGYASQQLWLPLCDSLFRPASQSAPPSASLSAWLTTDVKQGGHLLDRVEPHSRKHHRFYGYRQGANGTASS